VTEELKDTNPKTRFGKAKPPLELTLSTALLHMAKAQQSGDLRYGRMNWRTDPVTASIYVGALLRHTLKWWSGGIDFDPESGAHELGHVMNNAAILLDARDNHTLIDDRPPPNPRILELIAQLTEALEADDNQPKR
jgi:hypothetical protein